MLLYAYTKLGFSRNAFGSLFSTSSHEIENWVNFLQDSNQSTIIYPVGRHIGVRNIESNDMRFIRQNPNLKEITAMCLCPHKRFLAVWETHKNNLSAYIAFYDMKNIQFRSEKNIINVCDTEPTHQKVIRSISFSSDSNYIAIILEGPDFSVISWDCKNKSKWKINAQFDFNKTILTKISFSSENHQIWTSGHNHWKLWRVQENTLKPMPPFQGIGSHLFTSHCWLGDERIAGCTAEGEIIIVDDFQQKQIIENAFMSEDIYNISCIKAYSKGFFVASDNGVMALWVRSEENNQSTNKENQLYDFIRRWSPVVTKGVKIISMDVNTSEEYIIVALQNNNIALVNIKSIGLNDNMTREVKVDLVWRGFHSGPITCIDIAVQRPIIVTWSQDDSTIRLWNYYTFKCELTREYFAHKEMMIVEAAKPLLTVAIHPSGYYIAAGFKDKIRIYHVLHDDLRIFRNIERKFCTKIKFSNGGQWLACAVQKNLYIYRSYTLECVFSEKTSSSHVTDMKFTRNDTCLCMVSADGFMQRWVYNNGWWKLNDGPLSNKSLDFRACPFANTIEDELRVILLGGDGLRSAVKVLSRKDEIFQNYYGSDAKITAGDLVWTPNKINNLVIGTDKGLIKVYNMPLYHTEYDEFTAHYGEITQVVVSPDAKYIFTAGNDGCIFVFSITEYLNEHELFKPIGLEEEKVQNEDFTSMIVDEALADIVLVKRAEMEEWRKKQEQLRQEMEETTNRVETTIADVKNSFNKQMTDQEISHK